MKNFTYPVKKTRKITLATLLFFYILFSLLFLPYLQYSSLAALLITIGIYILILLIVFLSVAYNVPGRIARKMAKISIDDTGIHIGYRYLNWEDLAKITHGFPFFRRYPRILLQTKKSTASFWTFKMGSRPIAFLGYPFVYNEIIPLIEKHRPDIEIPEVVHEMQKTQSIHNLRDKILLGVIALLQIIILYIIFYLTTNTMIILPFMLMKGVAYFLPICQLIDDKFRDIPEEVSFLRAVISAVGFSFLLTPLTLLFGFSPLWTIFSLISISAIVLFIGLICIFFVKLTSLKRQILLFILMIATSISCIAYFHSPYPPFKDLSTLVGKESVIFIWGIDGRYIAGSFVNNKAKERFVIDTHELKRIPIPLHNGGDSIIWMDSSMVVRRATIRGDVNGIYIYDFKKEEEICIKNGECIRISQLNPISPNRKYLVWLNYDEKWDKLSIAFNSLLKNETQKIEFPKVNLSPEYKWSRVDWVDNENIVVSGKSRNNKGNGYYAIEHLALLHINIKTGISKLTVSKEQAAWWFPTNNSKYALMKTGDENPVMFYINLQTNQREKIQGKNIPSWIVDNRYGFRVFEKDGVNYFSKFDLLNGTESKICEIADKWELSGVSHDGKYALFTPSSFFSSAYFKILEINTLKHRYIDMRGISSGLGDHADFVLSHPHYSAWAPTSNQVIIESTHLILGNQKSIKRQCHLINVEEFFNTK